MPMSARSTSSCIPFAVLLFASTARAQDLSPFAPSTVDPPSPSAAPEQVAPSSAHVQPTPNSRHATAKSPSPAHPIELEAGGNGRYIFSLPVVGGELGLGVGLSRGATSRAEGWFRARYGYAQTLHGLSVHSARAGGAVTFTFGRVRPSIGFDLMWLGVERHTESDMIQHWGIGVSGGLNVDLLEVAEHQALYVGARIDVDVFPHKLIPRTLSGTGALVVGYRF
jgi:hypothetical protein